MQKNPATNFFFAPSGTFCYFSKGDSNLDASGFASSDHNSGMTLISPPLNFSPSGTLLPDQMAILQAEGADAATFLQGQLTHDVILLPVGQARLAGYCSAKGRLLASFLVLKLSPDKFILICHQDLIQAMQKRLSMFVMRAKVVLSDATSQCGIRGYLGEAAEAVFPDIKMLPSWSVLSSADQHLIALPPAICASHPCSRALCIGPANSNTSLSSLPDSMPTVTQEDWLMAEVLAGVPQVQAVTSDAFVPQMLNYESVNGVSFKKGCYPGQEVVARSQFRGTLKRRTFLVSGAERMTVGQEIFTPDDAEQACGTVVSAAYQHPSNAQEVSPAWALVSMQIAALAHSLHVDSSQGSSLKVWALPYPLLEDI